MPNCAGSPPKYLGTHDPSPSYTKGITKRPKENRVRVVKWYDVGIVTWVRILLESLRKTYEISLWGSRIFVIMKFWKCLDIVLNDSSCCYDGLWPKLVRCWVDIRWRLRPGYPKNRGNSAGFPARSLSTFIDLIIVRVRLRTYSSPKLIQWQHLGQKQP